MKQEWFKYIVLSGIVVGLYLLLVFLFFPNEFKIAINCALLAFMSGVLLLIICAWVPKDLVGYSFMLLNGVRVIVYIFFILYAVKSLKYDPIVIVLNFMVIYFGMLVPEISFLMKILNNTKK